MQRSSLLKRLNAQYKLIQQSTLLSALQQRCWLIQYWYAIKEYWAGFKSYKHWWWLDQYIWDFSSSKARNTVQTWFTVTFGKPCFVCFGQNIVWHERDVEFQTVEPYWVATTFIHLVPYEPRGKYLVQRVVLSDIFVHAFGCRHLLWNLENVCNDCLLAQAILFTSCLWGLQSGTDKVIYVLMLWFC